MRDDLGVANAAMPLPRVTRDMRDDLGVPVAVAGIPLPRVTRDMRDMREDIGVTADSLLLPWRGMRDDVGVTTADAPLLLPRDMRDDFCRLCPAGTRRLRS